MKKVIAVLN